MKNDFSSLTTTEGDNIVLRSVEAQGHLDGLLLSMKLKQVFCNDTKKNLEVTYTFPLAWGAVLLGLEATVGGKHMSGVVMARNEARERYEDAVETGNAPIMVEKAQGGVFCASLGSIKPGEKVVIELTYAQLLSFEQGRVRLVVPTTIAPRYGNAVTQGRLPPDQAAEASPLTEHQFGLSVTIAGPVTHARISSPSHEITQQRGAESIGDVVTVSLRSAAWLDRDFVLLLEDLDGLSIAIFGPDERSGEGHQAMIASYCPAPIATNPAALRLKILVDCSGSMAGESIAQAREALRPLANQLKPDDEVSYSRFGNQPQRVLSIVPATSRNVQTLVSAINDTNADLGGTEMTLALEDTFELRVGATHLAEEADVLLITDGEVWDAQTIVDAARRSGHRIYALGVGSAPAESLLREMAEATGGSCEFATPHEDMHEAVQRLLTRIRCALPVQPHLETARKPLWLSPLPRRLTAGETVHIFVRLPERPKQAPQLQLTGQALMHAKLSLRDDDLVARLVAAREISVTTDRDKACDLAEGYQLVTENTNLLLVIERAQAERTDGMPMLHQERPMLAAGWGGTSRIDLSPKIRYFRSDTSDVGLIRRSHFGAASSLSQDSVSVVWRCNRTNGTSAVAPLASGGVDDFQIPSFLRKSTDTAKPAAKRDAIQESVGTSPYPVRRGSAGTATAPQIIAAFNQAAESGQSFRKALRAVTALPLDYALTGLIEELSKDSGSPLKVWACYLYWLNDQVQITQQLSRASMLLVAHQLEAVIREFVVETQEIFAAQATTEST